MRLRMLSEDKEAEFDYDSIASKMWSEKCKEAHTKTNIGFDHENDEAIASRRIVIDIGEKKPLANPTFLCELRSAGGDWEYPCRYFRCQIVDGYIESYSSYTNPFFVIIPPHDHGNTRLVKGDTGGWAAVHNSGSDDPGEPDDRKCWEYLKKELTKMAHKKPSEKKQLPMAQRAK